MTKPRPNVIAAPGPCGDRPRGLALVMVLWVLVLLSVIAASFTATTRTETRLVANLVDGARAEALAEAGVYRAILALLEPDETQHWRADGTVYTFRFEGGEVLVSIQDEGGKIDLNQAQPELLRGLFISIGLDEHEADALIDAVGDFRDPDQLRRLNGAEDQDYEAAGLAHGAKDAAFEAVDEFRQVLGVDQALYERLAPLFTVYSGKTRINPYTAPRGVLSALPLLSPSDIEALLSARTQGAAEGERDIGLPNVLSAEEYFYPRNSPFSTIRAEARTAAGATFVREAVIRMQGSIGRPRADRLPFAIIAWRQGTSVRDREDTEKE